MNDKPGVFFVAVVLGTSVLLGDPATAAPAEPKPDQIAAELSGDLGYRPSSLLVRGPGSQFAILGNMALMDTGSALDLAPAAPQSWQEKIHVCHFFGKCRRKGRS